MIWRYVFGNSGDHTLADDYTNETFLRAFRRRHTYRCYGNGVLPWLVTIARNVVLDAARRASHRIEYLVPDFSDTGDYEADPEHVLVKRDEYRELHQRLASLSWDQATCLWLRYFKDYSVTETSLTMRRADTAVRALQYRAIRTLSARYTSDIS